MKDTKQSPVVPTDEELEREMPAELREILELLRATNRPAEGESIH